MPPSPKPPGTPEEKALVAACLSGDEAAWEQFVGRYSGLVWAMARRVLRSRRQADRAELIEDLYGEVFAALCRDGFRHLRRFEWKCSLARWISLLAHSTCRNVLARRPGPQVGSQDAAEWAAQLPDDAPPALAKLEKAEALEKLRSALAKAPPRERLILQLHFMDRLSYAQIAQAAAVSVNSVGPLISRAIGRLRKALGKE